MISLGKYYKKAYKRNLAIKLFEKKRNAGSSLIPFSIFGGGKKKGLRFVQHPNSMTALGWLV